MPRGGYRERAGRKPLSGIYQEQTKPVRIPLSKIEAVKSFLQSSISENYYEKHSNVDYDDLPFNTLENSYFPSQYSIPLYQSGISAGSPSPADDLIETNIDLNDYLIKNFAATFFVRVNGESMINAGIHDNDVLIVDRSIDAKNRDIIVAVVDGELTVKRLLIKNNMTTLLPENPAFEAIHINDDTSFKVWGVVTTVIHNTRK